MVTVKVPRDNGVSKLILEKYTRRLPHALMEEYLDFYGGLEALKSLSAKVLDDSYIEAYLKVIVGKEIGSVRLGKVYTTWLDLGSVHRDAPSAVRRYLRIINFINFLEESSVEILTKKIFSNETISAHCLINFIRPI